MFLRAVMVVAVIAGFCIAPASRGATEPTPASVTPNERHLADGEPSIDSLIGKFTHALEAKDKQLLRRLRVDRDEYLDIIMPGSVDDGQPRATYDDQAKQYFWGVLNGKSVYVEANLLNDFGGKSLKVTSVDYRKGIKRYRDYTAYKQLILTIDDGSGNPSEHMKIGSVAEVNGQYKFISYVRD